MWVFVMQWKYAVQFIGNADRITVHFCPKRRNLQLGVSDQHWQCL